ncbi:serine/arginine repetitive matrix protein 1-like [Panicum virgatum]|uniref:serine/arginine repetitive matrix protein 1-like n=1 Tax=Panicum virgatum TaxID=38727 RepID=UPI0019D5D27A|nr:serine/arginine repetitive matrix protein 1-like [Panicum virgatum]
MEDWRDLAGTVPNSSPRAPACCASLRWAARSTPATSTRLLPPGRRARRELHRRASHAFGLDDALLGLGDEPRWRRWERHSGETSRHARHALRASRNRPPPHLPLPPRLPFLPPSAPSRRSPRLPPPRLPSPMPLALPRHTTTRHRRRCGSPPPATSTAAAPLPHATGPRSPPPAPPRHTVPPRRLPAAPPLLAAGPLRYLRPSAPLSCHGAEEGVGGRERRRGKGYPI